MLENLDIFDTPLPKLDIGLNIFEQLDPKETEHSMILAEILNPNGKHKFGKQFLECFFDIVINNIGSDNIPFENEIYEVTAEKGGNDILIINSYGSKIIIIENKSNWAEDKPNQLWRYWYERIYSKNKISNTKYKILYLVPNSKKEPDNQTRTAPKHLNVDDNIKELPRDKLKIVYFKDEINTWLDKCLTIAEYKPEVYFYLKQYKDFWEGKMKDYLNNDELTKRFTGEKEQWQTFLNMIEQKDKLKVYWWEEFFNKLESGIKINNNWEYQKIDKNICCWVLKKFNKQMRNSFCLNLFFSGKYLVLALGAFCEKKYLIKITDLLNKNEKYSKPLIENMKLVNDKNRDDKHLKYEEYLSFIYDDKSVNDIDELAWYAYFESDILLEKLNNKFQYFFNDDITKIITSINEEVFNN